MMCHNNYEIYPGSGPWINALKVDYNIQYVINDKIGIYKSTALLSSRGGAYY